MEKIIEKSSEHYNFDLDIYEGPLDLLIHLAKSNKIEITDLELDVLIDQYINYIESVIHQGINVASEYLEMVAELLRIKSSSLLPNQQIEQFVDEFENLGYTREELLKKLLEYKKYKEAAIEFNYLIEEQTKGFFKQADSLFEYRDQNFQESIDVVRFNLLASAVFSRKKKAKQETRIIEIDELNVEEVIDELKNLTTETTFKQMCSKISHSQRIATFLAVLEAMKLQYICVSIINDEIIIEPVTQKGDINEA
ncbi:MAG: segregation and condensation protein A [Mycoplasmatales bacterium]